MRTVDNILIDINNAVKGNTKSFNKNLHSLCCELIELVSNSEEYSLVSKNYIEELLPITDIYHQIYLRTILMHMIPSSDTFCEVIKLCMECLDNVYLKQFMYQQCAVFRFNTPSVSSIQSDTLLWKFHQSIVSDFKNQLSEYLLPINIDERDKKLVVVICDQYISKLHGPTKTTSDRCKILIEKYNKRVLLINTGEVLNRVGELPIYNQKIGNYIEGFENLEVVNWKGCDIPFFQCPKGMPDIDIYIYLLKALQKLKPYYVVSIGADGFFAQLVNYIVPVLTVGLCPSRITFTETACQTISRDLNNDDLQLLNNVNVKLDSVIKSTFSSSCIEKTHSMNRKEIGVLENSIILCIVGGRLGIEMDEDFMQMLVEISYLNPNVEYVVLGGFGNGISIENLPCYEQLAEKIHFCGMVKDILAYLELCDLYINPRRIGGGTSAVEALHVGVPVISTNFGDVAVNVGSDFIVSDYAEMISKVNQYIADNEYYKSQSIKAKERAEYLLDSDRHFIDTLKEFESRIQFS